MAIKVRHDGNAAATAAAGVGSGRAKRRVETAKLAQNQPQHVQTISPAHASAPGASAPGIMSAGHATAPSAGGGSAPLTHAPTGASAASAPLTHAPTPTGGVGSRSGLLGGAGGLGGDDYKVTGTSIFDRPDDDSVWDPGNGGRWIRKWLPGEKEAEAAQRMNPVLAERAQIQQGVSDESWKQREQQKRDSWKQREQQKRDWNDADAQALLKAVLDQQDLSPMPGVKTSFPSAPQPDGGIGDKVSLVGETPEVFNKLKSISPELVGMRDSMNDGGLLKPFDTAMTMVLNKIYGNDVVPLQGGQPGSRNVGAIFDSIYQGGSQPAAPAAQDELSGVYDGGGSIFGEQYGGTTDRSLEFLHAPDTESASVGGESVAWKDYASSVGGMIYALLRIAQ